MQDKGLVSVITATYNMGEYVGLAVDSVLEQTYGHVESIVVDDGSRDDTPEIMVLFEDDPRVTYIRLPHNRGQATAKNTGLRAAKGDFIAFVDADNIWMPDKLERQLPLFECSDRIGVVYSDVKLIDGQGKILPYIQRSYYEGCITKHLLLENFVNFNSAVVKRECISKKGIFDESITMGIDWDLWLRLSTDYEFAFLDEATYSYRIWPNQMSHNKLKRLGCAEKILEKFFRKNAGSVSKRSQRMAWARLNCDYGKIYAQYKEPRKAFYSYFNAIGKDPLYFPVWKGIARMIIKRFKKKSVLNRRGMNDGPEHELPKR